VAWFVDSVPDGVLSFKALREEFTGSVLDVLMAHDELGVAYEDANLEPVNLPTAIARRLGVRRNTGALFVDAVTWSIDGTALEWARFWLLPEHFRFSVRRRKGIGRMPREDGES
jgi:DNA-binding GntR family transcriptional regulator